MSYSTSTGTTGTFGVAMSVTPSALDNGGAAITACGIQNGTTALPSYLSVDSSTCVISGTPTSALAATTYSLVATNSAGTSAAASVALTVNAAVPNLSYAASTGLTGVTGSAMTITPSTLNANGAVIAACGIKDGTTALPGYLSLAPTTCVISGTPTSALSATQYTLVATNSVGASSNATVTLAATLSSYSVSSAGTNVTLNPNSSQTVTYGSSQAIVVTPSNGYTTLSSVGGTCPAGSWSGTTYTTGAVTSSCTTSFSATLNSYSVTPSTTNVTLNPSGVQSVNHGSTLAFTVSPSTGYNTSSSVGGTCPAGSWNGAIYTTAAITSSCTVSFSANINSYSVTPSTSNVTLSPSGVQSVNYGSTKAFTVTPTTGYTTSASVGGTCAAGSWSSTTYTTGTITGACSVSFSASINSYSVTPSTTNVTLSPSGVQTVNYGSTKAFTVTPSANYTTSNTVGGTCPAGSWSSTTYTTGAITGACTVSFSASINTYAVTSSGTNVTLNPSTVQTVNYGSTQAFTVTPSYGYATSPSVAGTCPAGSWSGLTYTTGTITGACNISFSASNTTLVSVGNNSCATNVNTVYCWGYNPDGELGNNSTSDSHTPVEVVGVGNVGFLGSIISVATGSSTTCALTSSGNVYCWGDNNSGQLGNGNNTLGGSSTPVEVEGVGGSGYLSNIINLSNGGDTACAVSSAGNVYCWGGNGFGQLGNSTSSDGSVPPTPTDVLTPVEVKGVGGSGNLSGIVSVSAGGSSYVCALSSTGHVFCWGESAFGQLGNNSTDPLRILTPVEVVGVGASGYLSNIVSITTGSAHTCALSSAGNVYCWGDNGYGQLGNNSTAQANTPVEVLGVGGSGYLSGIISVTAGGSNTCALASSGNVYCWGYNNVGQLGNNTTTESHTPIEVKGVGNSGYLSSIVSVTTGGSETCAASSTGNLYCWGYNHYGALGNNSTTDSHTPVEVVGVGGTGFLSGIQISLTITTNLRLWLRADALTKNDGDTVTTWTDLSSAGNNATAPSSFEPIYKTSIINGKPILRFNGSAKMATATGDALSDFTVFIVFKDTGTAPAYERLLDKDYINGFWVGRASSTANTWVVGAEKAISPWYDGSATFTDGTPQILTAVRDHTGVSGPLIANKTTSNSISMSSTVTSTAVYGIGACYNDGDPSQRLTGDIAEILVYSAALSAADQATVQSYLISKYGL
ncbi:putative Ig domain-containing protein [Bdellovibrionota bacterium FG-2]